MRVVLQVVDKASVEIEGKTHSSINKGFLLFVGVCEGDTDENATKLAEKIAKLRVFEDEFGKTNLSLDDVKGEILSVSQFTLCADLKGSNRPSFSMAAKREEAIRLYNLFNDSLSGKGYKVSTGVFGADMKVNLVNNGPFTLVVEI